MNAHQNLYNKWADCIEEKAAAIKRAEAAEAINAELLEALKAVVSQVECFCGDNPSGVCPMHAARAAIAKAEAQK